MRRSTWMWEKACLTTGRLGSARLTTSSGLTRKRWGRTSHGFPSGIRQISGCALLDGVLLDILFQVV